VRVLVAESAEADFTSIESYFRPRNPAATDRILARIAAAVALLSTHPRIGHAGRKLGTREFVVTRTPFVLVYELTDEALTIVRILHSQRQWPTVAQYPRVSEPAPVPPERSRVTGWLVA